MPVPARRLAPLVAGALAFGCAAAAAPAAELPPGLVAEDMEALRVMNCHINATALADCDLKGYAARAIFFLFPAILVAIAVLLSCPLYCSFKYCCNCCGGRSQTMACFCACGSPKPLYARINLWRAKLYAIVIAGVCVIFFITGTAGAAKALGGVNDLFDAVTGVSKTLDVQVKRIEGALVVKTFNKDTGVEGTENMMAKTGVNISESANGVTKDIDAKLQEFAGTYKDAVAKYSWFPYLVFGLPLGIFACGVVAALLNIRHFAPMILFFVAVIIGIFMWTLNGVSSLVAFGFGDVCAEVAGVVNGERTVLAAVASCDDSMFTGFQNKFVELETKAAKQACDPIVAAKFVDSNAGDADDISMVEAEVAGGRMFDVPAGVECAGATFASVYEMTASVAVHPKISKFLAKKQADLTEKEAVVAGLPAVADKTTAQAAVATAKAALAKAKESLCTESIADASVKCTMRMCGESCLKADGQRSESGKLAKFLAVTFQSAAKASTALDTIGADYTNCDAAFRVFVSDFNAPCTRLVDGFVVLRMASGAIGILCLVFMYVMAFGAKRFAAFVDPEEAAQEAAADGPLKSTSPVDVSPSGPLSVPPQSGV